MRTSVIYFMASLYIPNSENTFAFNDNTKLFVGKCNRALLQSSKQ